VEPWSERERLFFEKEAIGFYVSGHPLHAYQRELQRYARPTVAAQRTRDKDKITLGGIVAALRERPTKTGKRMAWVTLEDLHGSLEVVCFPGKDGGRPVQDRNGKWQKGGPKPGFEQWEQLLKSDEPLLVTGTVERKDNGEGEATVQVLAEEIQSLRAVREKRAKRMELRLRADMVTDEKLLKLKEIAARHAGTTPVAVSLVLPGEAEAVIGGTQLKVAATEEFISAVDRLFGRNVVELG